MKQAAKTLHEPVKYDYRDHAGFSFPYAEYRQPLSPQRAGGSASPPSREETGTSYKAPYDSASYSSSGIF